MSGKYGLVRAGLGRRITRPALAALVSVTLAGIASPAGAATTIKQFPVPGGGTPAGIAVDSSGAVWFTEFAYGAVGRFANGRFTKFSLPNSSQSLVGDLINGPDGARWFVDDTNPVIWRISSTGVIKGFPIPPCTGCAYGGGSGTGNIISGPDGALWYSRPGNAAIGRITTSGQVREFPVPGSVGGYPGWIAAGPDGAIWFSVSDGIARMTTSGTFSEPWKGANYPGAIVTGPDGNLWFTVPFSDEVGRLTPSGHGTLFRIDTNCYPGDIASGDGSLWVTCNNLNLVYRVSTAGAITRIRLATNQNLDGIAQAPNGAMWFTDLPHGLLVRMTG